MSTEEKKKKVEERAKESSKRQEEGNFTREELEVKAKKASGQSQH